ncbi:hypothetical protein [Streptomyces canus]|uniref:hypothetical protein n=1 Tax=Streptomyces canus TaxID=58343 RepID=UPI002DDB5DD6|nr:hypothetical protein [Streptomyces canus]WSD87668.1 hypothetical protein OG925_26790 [Streptomyces canus]
MRTMGLRELVALILADLSAGTSEVPTVSYLPLDEGQVEVLLQDEDGVGVGFGVDPARSEADVLCALADRIPDAYVELYAVGLPIVPGDRVLDGPGRRAVVLPGGTVRRHRTVRTPRVT